MQSIHSSLSCSQDLKSGKTALHVMVEKGSLRDIQFLLETCHADVNATTFTSCTPLHIASGRGDISCVAYLLSQGASPDIMTDEGDTALDIAGSDEVGHSEVSVVNEQDTPQGF